MRRRFMSGSRYTSATLLKLFPYTCTHTHRDNGTMGQRCGFVVVKKQGGRKSGRGREYCCLETGKTGRSRENCCLETGKIRTGQGKLLFRDRENPDGAGKIAVWRRGKSERGRENCCLETGKFRTRQGILLFRDRENPDGAGKIAV